MKKFCEFCGIGIEGFKRNTRKYCSDNCKQLAYYARHGTVWGNPRPSDNSQISFNVKPHFTLNDSLDFDSDNAPHMQPESSFAKAETHVSNVKPSDEQVQKIELQSYSKVESSFGTSIAYHREQVESYLNFPERYWTSNLISNVKWVTIRLRCLLENILRLSSVGCIDMQTIGQLSGALNNLTESTYFRGLPKNYPFTELVLELKTKFQGMMKQATSGIISFRLSRSRKAQFVAYRLAVAGFVPKRKFSELDYSDGSRREYEKECVRRFQKEVSGEVNQ